MQIVIADFSNATLDWTAAAAPANNTFPSSGVPAGGPPFDGTDAQRICDGFLKASLFYGDHLEWNV